MFAPTPNPVPDSGEFKDNQGKAVTTIKTQGNSVFILVHGAFCGASCWDKVSVVLSRLGNQVISIDLPGHGQDSMPIAEQTGADYVSRIVQTINKCPDKVILVGHSMSGIHITQAAEECYEKIEKLVYVASFLPSSGQSANGIDGSGISPQNWFAMSTDGKTTDWGAQESVLRSFLCTGMSEADIQFLLAHVGPEAIEPLMSKAYPTTERWGKIPRAYVKCLKDGAITPAKYTKMLNINGCDQVYELDTGHICMLSEPEKLAFILNDIALRNLR